MPPTKRSRIPDEQLSPQVLEKRRRNTEAQRRRRFREREKSKQASSDGLPALNCGGPTRQRAVSLRDNVSASESNVAIVEPGMVETEIPFSLNSNVEFTGDGDSTTFYYGTLR